MPLLADERLDTIREILRRDGRVVIAHLAVKLMVSEMTVRRDLRQLASDGELTRVHGGAIVKGGVRFAERLRHHATAKRKAVRKLAPHLPQTGLIYLDGSTTMLHLVDEFRDCVDLQVATNHPDTFMRLAKTPGVTPLLLGGRLNPRTDTLVGELALNALETLAFDAAFFSAWGITTALGLLEVTLEDAAIKERVARRSQAVYLAVDASKLGKTASGVWCPKRKTATLATNLTKADRRLAPYRKIFAHII